MRRLPKGKSNAHGKYFTEQAKVAPGGMTEDRGADSDHDSEAEDQVDPQFQGRITEDDPTDLPLFQKCLAQHVQKLGLESVPGENEDAFLRRVAALNGSVKNVNPSEEVIVRALPLEGQVAFQCERMLQELHAGKLLSDPKALEEWYKKNGSYFHPGESFLSGQDRSLVFYLAWSAKEVIAQRRGNISSSSCNRPAASRRKIYSTCSA